MELSPQAFPEFVAALGKNGYVGGNVTVPHKEAAYQAVAHRDAAAEAVGAVNVLWVENGQLMGGNSDVHGFIDNLDTNAPGWLVTNARAVVMGAGGSARSAAYALSQRGVKVALVNRTVARAQALAQQFGPLVTAHTWQEFPSLLAGADLLVNCTSCGMDGKPALDVDLSPLKSSAVVYDVVYVPLETGLLAQAKARRLRCVDGLGLLLHQAGYGFEKWFGAKTQMTPELRALLAADIQAKTAR